MHITVLGVYDYSKPVLTAVLAKANLPYIWSQRHVFAPVFQQSICRNIRRNIPRSGSFGGIAS